MKKVVIIVCLITCIYDFCHSQNPIISFTLGTGVNSTGFIPVLSFDDDWEVKVPGSPNYQKVKIGHGIPSNSAQVYNCIQSFTSWGCRWLSPHIDPVTGKDLPLSISGTYWYRYKFNLPGCPAWGSQVNWNAMYSSSPLNQVYLNGSSFGFLNAPFIGGGCYTSGAIIINGIMNTCKAGVNYIEFAVVCNTTNGYTGFMLNADALIILCTGGALELTNSIGTAKTQFCIDEPVFLRPKHASQGPTYPPPNINSFKLKIDNGSGIFVTNSHKIKPDGFELKKFLSDNYSYVFQPNISYKVIMEVMVPCGVFEMSADLLFTCCAGSPSPFFKIEQRDGHLSLNSVAGGLHQWEVYSALEDGSIQSGPHTASGNGQSTAFDLEGPCYLIKHQVMNGCGSSCSSQRFCGANCLEDDCAIQPPFQIAYNLATKTLSWPPVTNAVIYVISVTANGCCASISSPVSHFVTGITSYYLDLFGAEEGGGPSPNCYSIVVQAKCASGMVISTSNSICIQ